MAIKNSVFNDFYLRSSIVLTFSIAALKIIYIKHIPQHHRSLSSCSYNLLALVSDNSRLRSVKVDPSTRQCQQTDGQINTNIK